MLIRPTVIFEFLPTVSKLCAIGITPDVETSPWDGRKPKIPQYDAGTLTLPPVSVPSEYGTWIQLMLI